MKISNEGLNLIKKFEGKYLKAYLCPANVWTIGYGHTGNVKKGDVITDKQAEDLLRKDMEHFEKGVDKLVTVPLNQHQFDALVSFAFNCGLGALEKSTLLRKLNAKDYKGASLEFDKWNKADGHVLKGLENRRNAEQFLFNKPVAVVKPIVKKPVPVYHIVKKGDTLTEIAEKYKVTVSGLVKLNKLNDKDLIHIGQKIRIK